MNFYCKPNILSGSKGLGFSGTSGIVGSIVTSLEGAGAGAGAGAEVNKKVAI
jgi:hypothetical protein